jgi:hypothetical protein
MIPGELDLLDAQDVTPLRFVPQAVSKRVFCFGEDGQVDRGVPGARTALRTRRDRTAVAPGRGHGDALTIAVAVGRF